MKYIELMEGAEPKLPGAPAGIQIMTPQQFVAKSAEGEEPEPKEVDEATLINTMQWPEVVNKVSSVMRAMGWTGKRKGDNGFVFSTKGQESDDQYYIVIIENNGNDTFTYSLGTFEGGRPDIGEQDILPMTEASVSELFKSIREGFGLMEATKLPAPTRPFGDEELTSYLDRIRGQEKKKTDKYKLPYIHRSSVVGYYNEEGKKYNTDAIKQALAERPKALLKKNEKMKHSDGELEQFFNVGFAALVGIALDEQTNELIIVNTCPGAGSCKVDCFAMKGGKVQFAGPWLSDGRILTYLLNDPEGFFNQLKAEISKEEAKGRKGGYKVSIRWHDAGDFFSPEYADMAFKLADSLPNVDFYAYTKVADVALGNKPKNFMINWSEGASSSQEKKVKGADPELEKTKNSRIVPSDLFYDLLVKDEKKNLVKGPEGQWQVIPDKLPELKQRLAKEYGLSANSILSYSEWESKAKGKDKSPLKYNVIITPGEPDLTAKDAGVLSTLLLKH